MYHGDTLGILREVITGIYRCWAATAAFSTRNSALNFNYFIVSTLIKRNLRFQRVVRDAPEHICLDGSGVGSAES